MPRKEYSFEIRDRAEELYVIEGLTYQETADETGVALATIKLWAAADTWREKRATYREEKKNLQGNLMDLRAKMLRKVLDSLDPQDVYALVALEKILAPKGKPGGTGEPGEPSKPHMTKEELLKFIREEVYGL